MLLDDEFYCILQLRANIMHMSGKSTDGCCNICKLFVSDVKYYHVSLSNSNICPADHP